jgi:hypothetical protein
MKQKQLVISAVLAVAFGAPSLGADLSAPVYKAQVAVPAPLSRTGFYVGSEVGGKWAVTTWTATSLSDTAAGTFRSQAVAALVRPS